MANTLEPIRRVPRSFKRLASLRLTVSLARPAHAESQVTVNLTRPLVPRLESVTTGVC